MAGEVPVEHRDAAREQSRLLVREGLQEGLLAVAGLPEDGAADRAAGAGGQGDDPQLRERGGPVPGPGRAEIVPVLLVSARFTSIPSAASAGIPATMTADGSSSPIRAPAACQKTSC